jgi:hypothetical protein
MTQTILEENNAGHKLCSTETAVLYQVGDVIHLHFGPGDVRTFMVAARHFDQDVKTGLLLGPVTLYVNQTLPSKSCPGQHVDTPAAPTKLEPMLVDKKAKKTR